MQIHDAEPYRKLTTPLSAEKFRRHFLLLVLMTWNIPPIVGLGFITFVDIMTPKQILGILVTPLEPLYILAWIVGTAIYLPRYAAPVSNWLASPDPNHAQKMIDTVRGFPLRFWGLFLVYLLLAPASVIIAAESFTDFVASPMDWFRVELVALIVSIIVGLPIFFLVMDLFGRAIGDIELARPIVTIRTKVFLIGALVPLLIDTMLVQYFWSRTRYFTGETFVIWLALEVVAVAGSLVFAHSFGQSLRPLRALFSATPGDNSEPDGRLKAQSTDEIGVLTNRYRRLLDKQRDYSKDLELQVAARTSELERINRELEAFSYSVSHDLRAPLRGIDGFSKALQEDYGNVLGMEGTAYLGRIRRATTKMGQLIDDLMNLSRVNRVELEPVTVSLSELAGEIIQELRLRDITRHVETEIGTVPPVRGDARLLKIALGNLLENAWKYTSKTQGARIEFGSHVENGECVYYVRDNGVGFDPTYSDKLFGAFQRLHTESDFPGTGIGLATCQRIIHRHGGRVFAQGSPGHGACFSFTLGQV